MPKIDLKIEASNIGVIGIEDGWHFEEAENTVNLCGINIGYV
jgi:hypothetical protein